MKTKKVIERLQQLDPTGEEEVSVCGRDIIEITIYPAYYDGALEVLERDESKSDVAEFQITKGRMIRSGNKIIINPMSIEEALLDNPELPVEIEAATDNEWRQMLVEKWREEGRKLQEEIKKREDSRRTNQ